MTKEITLCAKCAALMQEAYSVKKIAAGKDKKVDCENCGRHHYGGTFQITGKK